jgi:serine/threonine protein kinase
MKLIGSRWQATGETLGAGGQAQVRVVVDKSNVLPGNWAAKVFHNNNRAARIEREIRTARALFADHAPVIEIVDAYLEAEPSASNPWFVMRLASGGSLGNQLETTTSAYKGSIPAALLFFRSILQAVLQLHAKRVAHRDLKPDNIILIDEQPVLADLGLCLPLDDLEGSRLSGELERIGSIHYLPKEAFGRRPLTEDQFAFDAYALGKILHQLVGGKLLPGFTSSNEPEFSLLKIEYSPLMRGINRSVRGLLDDSPAVRLAILSQLLEQITDLLENTANPVLRDSASSALLLQAADAIGLYADSHPTPAPTANAKGDLDAIRDEVFIAWSESSVLSEIDRFIIQPNSNLLEFSKEPANGRLRSLLFGAGIQTRRSLEPLEDLGYPAFPSAEAGCAIGIQPKEHTTLPSIWLGCLVSIKDSDAIVSVAVAVRAKGALGNADIVPGTAKVMRLGFHEATQMTKLRGLAEQAAKDFTEALANNIVPKQ